MASLVFHWLSAPNPCPFALFPFWFVCICRSSPWVRSLGAASWEGFGSGCCGTSRVVAARCWGWWVRLNWMIWALISCFVRCTLFCCLYHPGFTVYAQSAPRSLKDASGRSWSVYSEEGCGRAGGIKAQYSSDKLAEIASGYFHYSLLICFIDWTRCANSFLQPSWSKHFLCVLAVSYGQQVCDFDVMKEASVDRISSEPSLCPGYSPIVSVWGVLCPQPIGLSFLLAPGSLCFACWDAEHVSSLR